jgi:hypothetical protein
VASVHFPDNRQQVPHPCSASEKTKKKKWKNDTSS